MQFEAKTFHNNQQKSSRSKTSALLPGQLPYYLQYGPRSLLYFAALKKGEKGFRWEETHWRCDPIKFASQRGIRVLIVEGMLSVELVSIRENNGMRERRNDLAVEICWCLPPNKQFYLNLDLIEKLPGK